MTVRRIVSNPSEGDRDEIEEIIPSETILRALREQGDGVESLPQLATLLGTRPPLEQFSVAEWVGDQQFPDSWKSYLLSRTRNSPTPYLAPIEILTVAASVFLDDIDVCIDVEPRNGVFSVWLQQWAPTVFVTSSNPSHQAMMSLAYPFRHHVDSAEFATSRVALCAELSSISLAPSDIGPPEPSYQPSLLDVAQRVASGEVRRSVLFIPANFLTTRYKANRVRQELLDMQTVAAAGLVRFDTGNRVYTVGLLVLEPNSGTSPRGIDVTIPVTPRVDLDELRNWRNFAPLSNPVTSMRPPVSESHMSLRKCQTSAQSLHASIVDSLQSELISALLPPGPRMRLSSALQSWTVGQWGRAPSPGELSLPVITNRDVSGDKMAPTLRCFDDETAEHARIEPGDVVMTMSGRPGRVKLIRDPGLFASNFIRVLRPKRDVITSDYLWWYLNSADAVRAVNKHSSQTGHNNLRVAFFDELAIIPSLEDQHRLVGVFQQACTALATAVDNVTLGSLVADPDRTAQQIIAATLATVAELVDAAEPSSPVPVR